MRQVIHAKKQAHDVSMRLLCDEFLDIDRLAVSFVSFSFSFSD